MGNNLVLPHLIVVKMVLEVGGEERSRETREGSNLSISQLLLLPTLVP